MKKILIILPFVLLLTAGCQTYSNQSYSDQPASPAAGGATTTSPTGPKFSDSSDFPNAYLISSVILSPEAQKALTGFQFNRQVMPDGTTQITLKANESGYKDQQYTLQPGQQLYFVDRSLVDDSGKESNERDDYGVIVDSQGYVVSGE